MKLHCHHDADGITSGVLFYTAMKNMGMEVDEIIYPDEFGGVDDWESGDTMVDMTPVDPTIEGMVYDHHPSHPPESERNYQLVWDSVPASLIVYNEFKDKLDYEDKWKVAVGVSGDGQPQVIPVEIWREYPELTIVYRSEYYNKTYDNPMYMILSSLVNSACRLGTPDISFKVLLDAKSPLDLLNNGTLQDNRKTVSKITKNAQSEGTKILLPKGVVLLTYNSLYSLSGRLASAMASSGTTSIALNEQDGSFSVRGALANLIKDILDDYPDDFKIGGHDGFLGGKCLNDPDLLSKILIEKL